MTHPISSGVPASTGSKTDAGSVDGCVVMAEQHPVEIAGVLLAQRLSLTGFIPSPEATRYLPQAVARRLSVVPLATGQDGSGPWLAVACTGDGGDDMGERLRRQLPPAMRIARCTATAQEIANALDRCYAAVLNDAQLFTVCSQEDSAARWLSQHPEGVIHLLERLLLLATRQGASDIHLSPEDDALDVRFRIDGVLHAPCRLCVSLHRALLVRIKVLAAIDIAETRQAQDGQFTQLIDARQMDFRVSCFPTRAGQNIVLRVLDQKRRHDTLDALGLPGPQCVQLRSLARRPEGLFVVCGPTGSGKSNTLHAMLGERDLQSINVMTLEDPVELIVPGVRQTSIDADHAMDYARGIRGLLRQDPDVLMIGEVRDSDSCAMAFRAALSGHPVLTSVHAGSAIAGLSRLRELGATPGQLAENLNGLAALRLLRKCCPDCAGQSSADADIVLRRVDCPLCRGTGYRGRQLLMELLVVTPAIAALIARQAGADELQEQSVRAGFRTLRQEAQSLVERGVTNRREVDRVLGSAD